MKASRRRLAVLSTLLIVLAASLSWKLFRRFHAEAEAQVEWTWSEAAGFVRESAVRGFKPSDLTLQGPRWQGGRIMLNGHDIQSGAGVVLFLRRFGDGPGSHDEEAFEMLTLELEEPSAGRVYRFGGPGVRGFYSKGNSVWGLGWYSHELEGTVRVSACSQEEIKISLDLKAPLVRTHENRHYGWEAMEMRRDLSCAAMARDALTPWLRGQTAHPQSAARK